MSLDIVRPGAMVSHPVKVQLEDGSHLHTDFVTDEAISPKAACVRGLARLDTDPSRIHFIEFGFDQSRWSVKALHRSHLGQARYHLVIHPKTGQIPPINREEVAAQLAPLVRELIYARTKFPSNQYMFAALAEEIGEMAEAWLTEGDTPHARHEALQVACVAMRIATEGVNRDGEDPQTLIGLALLEAEAREFFASITSRPDLSLRSEPRTGTF